MVPGKTKQPEDPRHTATQHFGWMLTPRKDPPLRIRVTPRENYYLSAAKLVAAATGPEESFLPVRRRDFKVQHTKSGRGFWYQSIMTMEKALD